MPPYFKSISSYYEILFNGKLIQIHDETHHQTFTSSDNYIWLCNIMKTSDILACNNPIFTVSMDILHIKNNDGSYVQIDDYTQMDNNHLIYSSSAKSHQWKLNNFNANECDPFRIDGIDFMMRFTPKQKEQSDEDEESILELNVLKLPMNISSMSITYSLRLKETNTEFWWFGQIDHNKRNDLSLVQWDSDCSSLSQIESLNTLSSSQSKSPSSSHSLVTP